MINSDLIIRWILAKLINLRTKKFNPASTKRGKNHSFVAVNYQRIEGHRAVSILEKIECANMDYRESERLIDNQFVFRKLVLNPWKAHGSYLFHLAQSTPTIIIHGVLVKKLSPEVCKDLNFIPVDEAFN